MARKAPRGIAFASRLAILIAIAGVLAVIVYSRLNRPLDVEQSVKLGAGEVRAIKMDGQRLPGTFTVTFSSTATSVNVYLVKEADVDAATQALLNYQTPKDTLASMLKSKEGSVKAPIPARTGFAVLLAGAAKDTDVTVQVTSK